MSQAIGVTGTRHQPTEEQESWLRCMLEVTAANGTHKELHHGDCVGADALAHDIAEELGFYIVVHPPTNARYRAYRRPTRGEVREPRDYLERDRDVVNESSHVLALPERVVSASPQDWPARGSGTLYTARCAWRTFKPVFVCLPTGTTLELAR